MNEVKFTIITPSYNQGKYIENTIKSVIKQDYENWELLIQDAASTDSTIEVCSKYLSDSRITLTSEKDKGFADAVNKGIEKSNGKWLLILNSDDFLASSDVLSYINLLIKANSKLYLVTGKSNLVNLKTKIKTEKNSGVDEVFIKTINPDNVYNFKESFSQPSTFFRIDRVKQIGKLDTELDMVADTDLWIRYMLYKPKIIKNAIRTNKALSIVTEHDEQRTMKPHLFYYGRAKMAAKHYYNNNIELTDDLKYKHAISLINNSIDYYYYKRINNKPNIELYTTFMNTKFPLKKRIKYYLSFIFGMKHILYKYYSVRDIKN